MSVTVKGTTARAEIGSTAHFLFENEDDKSLTTATMTVSSDDNTTHSYANTTNFYITLKPRSAVRKEVADVNGDGNVTIADVTTLVNIILGKN